MTADLLREAARSMRERAEAAAALWERELHSDFPWYSAETLYEDMGHDDEPAEHIASWHPAVALAVADWLDSQAELQDVLLEHGARGLDGPDPGAFAVARAYLGRES